MLQMLKIVRMSSSRTEAYLTWAEYFRLRKSRKLFERIGGLLIGGGSFLGGSIYFGTVADFDPMEPVFGMDPMLAYGGASILMGGLGTAFGIMGSGQIWRLAYRRSVLSSIDKKEKEFFDRILKHRPQQIKMNIQNPLPDYYGEKIKSVADYREWLKKQREWRVKMGVKK